MTNEKKSGIMTVGCMEIVSFPEFGVQNIIAKIDTGAFSGALHCTDIKVARNKSSSERVLSFRPLDESSEIIHTTKFIETYVRSATGHRVRRYIVDTEIMIQGRILPIRIGLSDRAMMIRPALIGRRILRENNIIVDVCLNEEYDIEGENKK